MSSEPPLPVTLDHILSGVRAQLEVELRSYADQVASIAAKDRDRAVEQAHRAAAEERDRAVERVAAELRRQAADQVEEARRAADAQFHELRRAREAADAHTLELQRERDAAEAQLRESRHTADARIADLAAERDRLRAELGAVQRQLQDLERRELEKRELDERVAAARVRAHPAPAVRALDDSASLGEVFERLTESALTYCDRAVLLMVKNDRLQPWRTLGFDEPEDIRGELSAETAGMIGIAVREARVLTHGGNAAAPLPPFVLASDISEASSFPVMVAGSVVAVLYADIAEERRPESTWVADLDVLTRHASRVLEAITMQQAMGLRPTGVARPSQFAPAASPSRAGDASVRGD